MISKRHAASRWGERLDPAALRVRKMSTSVVICWEVSGLQEFGRLTRDEHWIHVDPDRASGYAATTRASTPASLRARTISIPTGPCTAASCSPCSTTPWAGPTEQVLALTGSWPSWGSPAAPRRSSCPTTPAWSSRAVGEVTQAARGPARPSHRLGRRILLSDWRDGDPVRMGGLDCAYLVRA